MHRQQEEKRFIQMEQFGNFKRKVTFFLSLTKNEQRVVRETYTTVLVIKHTNTFQSLN